MNIEDIKMGTKFEICNGDYDDWWGEIMAVSVEMGAVFTRSWFGNHYGDVKFQYIEDLEECNLYVPKPPEPRPEKKFKRIWGKIYILED